MTSVEPDTISLAEAAERLGVHYMTAYRYVRTGRLPATKARGQWRVAPSDLVLVKSPVEPTAAGEAPTAAAPGRAGAAIRLRHRAIAGDDAGAWTVVSEALASGTVATDVHLEVIIPAMREIGDQWQAGHLTIAEEHTATAVVQRLLGRLTPMFRHQGRRRATIVLGAVAGDFHSLPTALMSDLLADRRITAVDLGANTPTMAFVETARALDGRVAIALCATTTEALDSLRSTAVDIRSAVPDITLFAGGAAGASIVDELPVDGGAGSADDALAMFEAFATS